jgi:hypothetical protein
MRKRLARLFTIKTRTDAWLMTYAIALGAVERGATYLETYPGYGGWLLALACTGVVFLVGAKLLDSVTPGRLAMVEAAPQRVISGAALRRPVAVSRSRPRARLARHGSGAPASLRTD